MIEPITPAQFHESEGVEDWRLTSEGATAFFRTRSFVESAQFVQAISELPGDKPGVDIRNGPRIAPPILIRAVHEIDGLPGITCIRSLVCLKTTN